MINLLTDRDNALLLKIAEQIAPTEDGKTKQDMVKQMLSSTEFLIQENIPSILNSQDGEVIVSLKMPVNQAFDAIIKMLASSVNADEIKLAQHQIQALVAYAMMVLVKNRIDDDKEALKSNKEYEDGLRKEGVENYLYAREVAETERDLDRERYI